MNNEKSEKQKAVSLLYKRVISVETTELVRSYDVSSYDGKVLKREQKATFCIINGEKYIMNGSLSHDAQNFIKNMQRNGLVKDSDFVHAFHQSTYKGKRIVVFIKVKPLLMLKNDLFEYIKGLMYVNKDEHKRVYSMMEDSTPIAENVISDERIKESEYAFSRRNQLIVEGSQERRLEDARQESKVLEAERISNNAQSGLVVSNIDFSDKDVEELSFKIEHDEMSPDILRLLVHHKNLEGVGDSVDDGMVLNYSQMKALGKALLFAGEYVETLYSRNK